MNIDVISPFPFEALPRVWSWIQPFRAKVSDDFGPQSLDEFMSGMEAKWDQQKTWAVYGDLELGGMIIYQELTPWVGTAHFLLKPDFQRKGLSVKAARLAATEIFEGERIGKLVFHPLAGNLAIGSLLINIGAKREGTLTGHTLVGGKPTDIWMYGLSREGFNNAICSSSTNHRVISGRGNGDSGGSPGRQAEDSDQHDHADTDAGDAAANAAAHLVQH